MISPPRAAREKDKDKDFFANDGWAPPESPTHPPDVWGFDDRHDPPPLISTALAAKGQFIYFLVVFL